MDSNSHWIVVENHGITDGSIFGPEDTDDNWYNNMILQPNGLYPTGISSHFIPVEMQKGNLQAQQAAIADIPVNSPPAPSTQGYQQQLYHQPLNAATNFPPGENDFECRWLQQDGGNPCGQRFSDKRELVMRLNRVHGVNGSATRVITCRWLPHPTLTVCNRLLKRCSFSRHVDVHFRHSIACPYQGCGKTYSRRDSLKIHMKTHSNVIFNT